MIEHAFQAEHFINRELSWLEFNARVLEEAEDQTNPLLERVKFLSIFSSNLDEFFMVRVAGLREQAFGDGAPQDYTPDGLRAITQLQRVAKRTQELVAGAVSLLERIGLAAAGPRGHSTSWPHEELRRAAARALDRFFRERAFPILTPMAIDPSHPSPHFHNRQLVSGAPCSRRHHGLGPEAIVRGRAVAAGAAAIRAARARPDEQRVHPARSTPSPRGCRSCSAGSTSCTGRRSASRATAISSCWSKNPTTCCG